MTPQTDPSDDIRRQVREGYGQIARSGRFTLAPQGDSTSQSCAPGGGCCGGSNVTPEQLAAAIGYSAGDLSQVPEGANLGLSCGNPTAIAALKPGEILLDLGSGGGFDCFVAGPKVGAAGRVIGVDMTADMIARARKNLASYRAQTGLDNVEFRLGEIENLPAGDASVDVVISNCVLNLSPDKARVWREIARVVKPGGRVAVSDLALLQPLPKAVADDIEALIGCVAGAPLVEQTRAEMKAAGFWQIQLTPKPGYVQAMVDANDAIYRRLMDHLPAGAKVEDYVISLDIRAQLPGNSECRQSTCCS